MKSYNHLYENCISEENRRISLNLAKHSKRMRRIIKSRHHMDDMVIFGSNKKVLHRTRQAISDYLENELGLSLKDNWQVFRFSYGNDKGRDLDFMGFRFFRNRTILRKTIMYKATRKAIKLSQKEKPTIHDARQMLSYLGWIDCTDTYKMYRRWIKPYVSFKQLKRKISQHDRYDDRRVYLSKGG